MCEKEVVKVKVKVKVEVEVEEKVVVEEEEEKIGTITFVTNKDKTKVLFAEAGSDFTDPLLSFLCWPLGTIMKVMRERYGENAPTIGSLSTLYNGVENLDSIHFPTEEAKTLLLNPTSLDDDKWPSLYENFNDSEASFTIGDDLMVMPIVEGSVVSTLSNLRLAMIDMDGAKTIDVDFDYCKMLDLLKVSLISRNPLTAILFPGCVEGISRAAAQGSVVEKIGNKSMHINSKKMIVKVMMQKSTNKLLFAQADGDFVSFLFGVLILPLGRVEWYLHSRTGVRGMDNLHRSVANNLYMNDYIDHDTKELLFKPALPKDKESSANKYAALNFDPRRSQYHVRESRMYMVSDDLTVSPLSITSSVRAIGRMKIPLSDVEEMQLQVGFQEGLSILRAALTSTTALTDGLIKPMLKKQSEPENYHT